METKVNATVENVNEVIINKFNLSKIVYIMI